MLDNQSALDRQRIAELEERLRKAEIRISAMVRSLDVMVPGWRYSMPELNGAEHVDGR